MADWSELKRLAEAELSLRAAGETYEGEIEWLDALDEFNDAVDAETILALIAENEELAERIRLFELIHGGRASELYHQISALHAEVRRLKIAAGEDVPPLPEEFVGPLPENCNARLRRKIKEQSNG